MAEGGTSINAGSDVIFDFFCEICIEDGKQLEAEGYCVECGEYLCLSCYSGHKTTRFTRHHVLQDKTSMPKNTPLAQDGVRKGIATKCNKHNGELVKYFCTSHCTLFCNACFVEDHRGCKDLTSIVEESVNILDSREYSDSIASLQAVEYMLREEAKFARGNKATSQKCCDDVVASGRQHTEDAIRRLLEYEQSIAKCAKQMQSDDEERMDTVLKECDVMSDKTEQLLSTIKSLHSSKSVCQLYIAMKEAETDVKALQHNISQLDKSNCVEMFTFEPNVDLLSIPNVLGKITNEIRHTNVVNYPSSSSPSNVTATKLMEIDAISIGELKYCCITGQAIMNENQLIVADSCNNRLKLIDTETNTLIAALDATEPWDVAAIYKYQAVVTLPERRKILVVKVTDTLVEEREISVRGECQGVAYIMGKLLVTFDDKPRLEILDLHGTVLKTIENDSAGRPLFGQPWFVCAGQDGETVYVSDYTRRTVTSLTLDGVVKAVLYKDKELQPGNVCTDHHGNVYVCDINSQKVHMLTADCRQGNVILTRADGLDSEVWSVSHCRDTNRLFIGMDKNRLKCYQLS